MQCTLNTRHVLCLLSCLRGHSRSLCQHEWLPLTGTTALAMQHLPLAQEQLARDPVAVGRAEGSCEPLVLLSVLCHAIPWDWGSPAQQAPGNAAQGSQQQGTRDSQHSHEPGWWLPHCLHLCDNQTLLQRCLWMWLGEGTHEGQGASRTWKHRLHWAVLTVR